MQRHNLSAAYVEASSRDYNLLLDSMEEHGFDSAFPIVIFEGCILDGFHRWKAAKQLGINPTMVEFEGSAQEADNYAFRANVARRQLTKQQHTLVLVLRNRRLAKSLRKTQRQLARQAGYDSATFVGQIDTLVDQDPELANAAARGDISVTKALRQGIGQDNVESGSYDSRSDKCSRVKVNKSYAEDFNRKRMKLGLSSQVAANQAFACWIKYDSFLSEIATLKKSYVNPVSVEKREQITALHARLNPQ